MNFNLYFILMDALARRSIAGYGSRDKAASSKKEAKGRKSVNALMTDLGLIHTIYVRKQKIDSPRQYHRLFLLIICY